MRRLVAFALPVLLLAGTAAGQTWRIGVALDFSEGLLDVGLLLLGAKPEG